MKYIYKFLRILAALLLLCFAFVVLVVLFAFGGNQTSKPAAKQ